MIITNELGLPAPIVDMANRAYPIEDKVFHATSLLKGVREAILERRHFDEITQDVSDMIWLLFGTAAHSVLESHKETDTQFKEVRLSAEVDGYTVTGMFDLYDSEKGIIWDYKTCSVWKVIYGDYTDWRRQLLIYAFLLRKAGFHAKEGRILAIMKDHKNMDAKTKPDYPKKPAKVIRFAFTEQDIDEAETWIADRIDQIKQAERLPDYELPICTPEERYNSGDKYAVMAKGKKRAMRVLDSMEEAETWMAANGGDLIEVRPGEDKKCPDYCSCSAFCNYYQQQIALRSERV